MCVIVMVYYVKGESVRMGKGVCVGGIVLTRNSQRRNKHKAGYRKKRRSIQVRDVRSRNLLVPISKKYSGV